MSLADRTTYRTRRRDVFVVGTAGPPAFKITDVLRDAGLSVSSVLTTDAADVAFACQQATEELTQPAADTLDGALVVSCWQWPGVGGAVDEVVHSCLYPDWPGRPWIQLSAVPHSCGYAHPLLTAPLISVGHGEQTCLPGPATGLLLQQARDALPTGDSVYARVLDALMTWMPAVAKLVHRPRSWAHRGSAPAAAAGLLCPSAPHLRG
jgi:hypothetical protein